MNLLDLVLTSEFQAILKMRLETFRLPSPRNTGLDRDCGPSGVDWHQLARSWTGPIETPVTSRLLEHSPAVVAYADSLRVTCLQNPNSRIE